jgi:tetratricopeptide (TPR) repeat protein
LLDLMKSAVATRNDGAEGHGIAGDEDPEALLDLVSLVTEGLHYALPVRVAETDTLGIEAPDGRRAEISLLRLHGGNVTCYRDIRSIAGGRCRIVAQKLLSLTSKEEVRWESEDILLRAEARGAPIYNIAATGDNEWAPLVLLPDRQTKTFLGREAEMARLYEWLADTDSRACQVFGDGGIGKTTLILEFLHRLIEKPSLVPPDFRPDVISYFTAKKTRWGMKGLERIQASSVVIADVAKAVVRAWEAAPLSKEWLSDDPLPTIDRLGQYAKQTFGVDRQRHLLVIDNTETLADSEDGVRALGRHLSHFAKRVGRVLITSRRREDIEARSIEVFPLSETEGLELLRARGRELALQPLLTAGERTLKKYAFELGLRPLVLEVFVQTLLEPGIGLQSAFDRVLRMQKQDLGDFLYQDAWGRMADRTRHLFLLMTRVAEVLDETLVKLCAHETQVSLLGVYDALEASRGIATVSRISGFVHVTFHPDFLRFCENRTVDVGGEAMPSVASVERVRRRYGEFLKAQERQILDRVARAFRRPFARLAYQAFQEERWEDCEMYYELAVAEDPSNAMLFDRYSMFLYKMRRYADALGKSVRATQIDPQEADAWFTRGMIESRLGKLADALRSLERAMAAGKPAHLVHIQMSYAYLGVNPPDYASARECLEAAERALPATGGPFVASARREMEAISRRLRQPKGMYP